MIPADQYDDIGLAVAALLTAAASVISSLVLGFKSRAESRLARETSEKIHSSITQTNGGSSVKDALNRIERGQQEIRADVGGLRVDVRLSQERDVALDARITAVERGCRRQHVE